MSQTRLYRDQHERLRQLAGEMLGLGADGTPAAYRTLLAKLAGSVKMHLKGEDDSLYPRLSAHQDAAVRDKAASLQQSMGGLATAFGAFYEKWIAAGAIAADTPGYVTEMCAVLGALASRMDMEDTELYDLADHVLSV